MIGRRIARINVKAAHRVAARATEFGRAGRRDGDPAMPAGRADGLAADVRVFRLGNWRPGKRNDAHCSICPNVTSALPMEALITALSQAHG